MKADRVLNARGWSFPWCFLKAMSMLKNLEPGQILEVLGTDPLTLKYLPRILERTDNQLIEAEKKPDFFRLYLRRGPGVEGGCAAEK